MEAYEKPKVSDCQDETKDLSVSKRKRSAKMRKIVAHVPDTKYLSYLSGLTARELHYIARENEIYGHTSLRKADLIKFLDWHCVKREDEDQEDFTHEVIQNYLGRQTFPDTLRAWVGLFVSDKSVSEHFVQIILNTLSSMCYFGKIRVKKHVKYRKCKCIMVYMSDQSEDSVEDLSDDDLSD